MVSQSQRFERMLGEARDTVAVLRARGATTTALELELKRGERAVLGRRWDEAQSRIDRVLGSRDRSLPGRDGARDERSPGDAALIIGITPDAVMEKLDLVRRRIEVLHQISLDTSGMEAALARADVMLAGGYVASADSIADELLVLTKAAAEGMRQLAKPKACATHGMAEGPTAANGGDFLSVLRTAVTDLAGARGWVTEERARTLIDETLPKFYLLERHVAEQLHRHESASAVGAQSLRADLMRDLGEPTIALTAAVQALRGETAPAIDRLRDASASLEARLAASIASLATADEGIRRIDAVVAAHSRALDDHAAELDHQRERVEAAADADSVAALDEALTALNARVDACAARTDLDALSASGAAAGEAQRATEESLRALTASTRHDDRELARNIDALADRLVETSDEQGGVLVGLEAAIDDLRTRLATMPEMTSAVRAQVESLSGEVRQIKTRLDDHAAVAERADTDGTRSFAVFADALAGKADAAAIVALTARLEGLRDAVAKPKRDERAEAALAEIRTELEQLSLRVVGAAGAGEVAALADRITGQDARLARLDSGQARSADSDVVAALADQLADLRVAADRLARRQDQAVEADVIARLEARLDALARSHAEAIDANGVADVVALERNMAEVRATIADLTSAAEADDTKARIDALVSQSEALRTDLARLANSREADPAEARMDALATQCAELRVDLARLADGRDADATAARLAALATQYEALRADLARLADGRDADDTAARVAALATQYEALRADLAGLADGRDADATAARVAALTTQYEALRADLAGLANGRDAGAADARVAELAAQYEAMRADIVRLDALREGLLQAMTALRDETKAALRDVGKPAAADSGARIAASEIAANAAAERGAALAGDVVDLRRAFDELVRRSDVAAAAPHDAEAAQAERLADIEARVASLAGGRATFDDMAARVEALGKRLDAVTGDVARADESRHRLAALEARPRLPDDDMKALEERLVARIQPTGLDLRALRKALPELLASPEATGQVMDAVMIEVLGGRIRQVIRDEVQRAMVGGADNSGPKVIPRIIEPFAPRKPH